MNHSGDGTGASLQRRRPHSFIVAPSISPTPSSPDPDQSTTSLTEEEDDTDDTASEHANMISPRSSNYDRLEGGMGNSRMGSRSVPWKKIAIGAAVIVGLVWLFSPGGNSAGGGWEGPVDGPVDVEPLPPPNTEHGKPEADVAVPPPTMTSLSVPRPTSYESDPDHSKTVYCTSPHEPSAPLVQYGLMIDAGSTGSRIHIYKFHNCGPSPVYEYEIFRQTRPGLSMYSGEPERAAQSLDVLLDVAVQSVPPALHKCTPVAVKATAGLRLLGQAQSAEILAAVRHRLGTVYPFPVAEQEGVTIMNGRDEGVYAWITTNYLMDTIRADSPLGAPTYAVLDLGGASTQIVFEPVFDASKPDSALLEGEHKYELKFGGRTHVLYQHSYLGYGLMRARRSVHKLVDFMASLRMRPTSPPSNQIGNPCLAKGTTREVEVLNDDKKTSKKIMMVGEDIGGFESCNRVIELVMAKDSICEVKPCSFDGVYQPSLLDTFPQGKIMLLSYFYDRVHLLLPTPTPLRLTIATLSDLATQVCLGKPAWEKRWAGNAAALEDLALRPEYCLDLTFMHALLRLGYEFDDEREVEIGKQINGTELGWALGAVIAMVGGELRCEV